MANSIKKLVSRRYARLKTSSICLDCYLKHGFKYSFSSESEYAGKLIIPYLCDQCGGKTFHHSISLRMPINIIDLIRNDIINEIIVATIISEIDIIKEVYLHKKLNIFQNGSLKSGVEIDVIAITNNNELILIEVTKGNDLSNLTPLIQGKIDHYKNNQIPYDLLFYVTMQLDAKKYIPIDNKTYLFGARQLPNIKEKIEYRIKKDLHYEETDLDTEDTIPEKDTSYINGTVKKWFLNSGYGFIESDEKSEDYFVHISDVQDNTILDIRQKVKFKEKITKKGFQAIDVELIDKNL
jgi:cold shock CspA family protein